MTDIGEGVAVTVSEDVKAETGSIKVSVRDICTGKRIPEPNITIGKESKDGDDQGEASFSDLSVGAVNVKVKKHFEEADYITFIVNKIPFSKKSITRSWEAKSAEQDVAIIAKSKETKLRIEIPVFRVEEGVRFCRKDLKIRGMSDIDYGHWWIEIGDKSYGWWPEEGHLGAKDMPAPAEPPPLPANAGASAKIMHIAAMANYKAQMARYSANYSTVGQYGQAFYKTFKGVPGVLNGSEERKRMERDPYHEKWKVGKTDEDYHPVIRDCRTKGEIYKAIRKFALAYSGEWSWVLESGNNCHTFQVTAMSSLDLNRVKKI